MNRFIISIIFCVAFSTNLFAQKNLLRELLDLPAPPPVSRPEPKTEAKLERPAEFFSKSKVPADDAPIEELLDYWAKQNQTGELDYLPEISDASLTRILEFCEDEPETLKNYLTVIEKKPKFAADVAKIFDAQSSGEKVTPYWREQIKTWLKYNTKLYVDKLIADVRQVKDQEDRDTENERELFALAKVDWNSAAPILERLAADKTQPFTAVSARWAMYQHAIAAEDSSAAEKYRAELKAIVADKNAQSGVRDKAMDALVVTPHWEGREDWYISLLEDETLLKMQEEGFTGLTTLIRHSPPGKWTDTMLKLVGNKNASVHNSAVRNLFSMLDASRPDVTVALLPWLSNPAWAKESDDNERGVLIKYVGATDVPEAVPGLISVVRNEEENRALAANALIRYKSALAVPALRIALQSEQNELTRTALIEALIASGGFTVEEQTAALESYAAFISTPEGKKLVEREDRYYGSGDHNTEFDDEEEEVEPQKKIAPLPLAVSIGQQIGEMDEPSDALILQVIERRKELLKTKPAIAQVLTDVLKNWEGRAADTFRLNEIKNNHADVQTIIKVLTARKILREKFAAEIAQMRGATGAASGLAACITEDAGELASAFHSDDADTRISVLACARLLRAPLPVAEVGTLLKNQNKLLALAAERYLETEDGQEARKLIWAAHPNEAVILGARDAFNPAKQTSSDYLLFMLFKSVGNFLVDGYRVFDALDKDEEKLRREVLENAGLQMIYAYGNFYIRVYQDRAVFSYYEDAARYRERNLTEKEFESFNRLVREKNLGSVSPLFECEAGSGGCHPSQLLMLNRNGGRRVFGYSDYAKGIGDLGKLLLEFQQTEGKLRYELEKHVAGLQVLAADNRYTVKTVWKNGDDFRALVVDKIKEAEKEEELQRLNRTENENEEMDYAERSRIQTKRRKEREFENYSWRAVTKDGKLDEAIAEPEAIPALRNQLEVAPDNFFDDDEFGWKVKSGAFQIRTGSGENIGLWRTNRAQTTRILAGGYDSPLVSADGKWAIAVKSDLESENDLSTLVRVNLTTNREAKINLPPAGQFRTVAFVAAHNKFLVFRADYEYDEDEGRRTKQTEYFLIDPLSGAAQPVKGEFRPLEQQTFRPLQPTGKPNEFWAVMAEEKTTTVGTYNAKTFTFKPLLKIPEIRLTNMDIWADEAEGKVYFVYAGLGGRDGHLLSLPLPR